MHAQTVSSFLQIDHHDQSKESYQLMAAMIREVGDRMKMSSDDFSQLHHAVRELEWMLLRSQEFDDSSKEILQLFAAEELTTFNDLYCHWETSLERRFVHHLARDVCGHVVDYPLFARFERLISREVGLLHNRKPRRVLFIGSGPMPITAFCLRHRLNTKIDCLERSQQAVEESKVVIEYLNQSEYIHVIHGRGQSFDVSDYDMILIALLAKPKKTILDNIVKTCRDDVNIICRTSKDARCFFYEPTGLEDIPTSLEVVKAAYAGVDDTISSYLLTKR